MSRDLPPDTVGREIVENGIHKDFQANLSPAPKIYVPGEQNASPKTSPKSGALIRPDSSDFNKWETNTGHDIKVSESSSIFGDSRLEDHDAVALANPLWFRRFVTLTIIINAVQLGVCVHYKEVNTWCVLSEALFTVVFGSELVLKVCAQGTRYFHYHWNLIDFILVALAVIDLLFTISRAASGGNTCRICARFSLLRLMKLSRTLRLLRILRARRELTVLAEGLISSLKAMVWVATLLGVLVYAFGIFAFGAFRDEDVNVEWEEPYFESLGISMLTLFDLSIGDLWGDVIRPLANAKSKAWATCAILFFIGYIFVSSFGILNLLIGIITESTAKAAFEYERQTDASMKKEKMHQVYTSAEQVFDSVDTDHSSTITAEELENVDGDKLNELLASVNLPLGFSIADLHMMCSPNESIDKREFIQAMRRIVFCNQFERDCIFQHAINDIRRRFSKLEQYLKELKKEFKILHRSSAEKLHSSLSELVDLQATYRPDDVIQSALRIIETRTANATLAPDDVRADDASRAGAVNTELLSAELRALKDFLTVEIRNVRRNVKEDLRILEEGLLGENRQLSLAERSSFHELAPLMDPTQGSQLPQPGFPFRTEEGVASSNGDQQKSNMRSGLESTQGFSGHKHSSSASSTSTEGSYKSGLYSVLRYGNSSTAGAANSSQQPTPRQATHTFKHGEHLGFKVSAHGTVVEVSGDGQAGKIGIKAGDRVLKVGDAVYSPDVLKSFAEGRSNYTITFQVGRKDTASLNWDRLMNGKV